jgi:hypothetical protein
MSTTTFPAIGAKMPDGSIYAGVSPDTGRAMYTTPKDAPLTCTFNQAGEYAAKLDAHGHRDWRPPTKAELNVLFENRHAIGNFDTSGSHSASWYRSSSPGYLYGAWAQRFRDGNRYNDGRSNQLSLRCVRG